MNPADWAVSGLRTDNPIRAIYPRQGHAQGDDQHRPGQGSQGPVVIQEAEQHATVRITTTVAVRRTV